MSPGIDHAVLLQTVTDTDVREACDICREVGVASICVKSCHVPLAAQQLAGSTVKVSTVIGFPHGGHATEICPTLEAVYANLGFPSVSQAYPESFETEFWR